MILLSLSYLVMTINMYSQNAVWSQASRAKHTEFQSFLCLVGPQNFYPLEKASPCDQQAVTSSALSSNIISDEPSSELASSSFTCSSELNCIQLNIMISLNFMQAMIMEWHVMPVWWTMFYTALWQGSTYRHGAGLGTRREDGGRIEMLLEKTVCPDTLQLRTKFKPLYFNQSNRNGFMTINSYVTLHDFSKPSVWCQTCSQGALLILQSHVSPQLHQRL